MDRISKRLVIVAMLLALAVPSRAQTPSASITFSSRTVTGDTEYRRAEGTLHFQDKSYTFEVHGVRVATESAGRPEGAGEVYNEGAGDVFNLQRLEDFAGNYLPVTPGASIEGEGKATIVENQKGVRIKFHSTTPGTRVLEWPADGAVLSLK